MLGSLKFLVTMMVALASVSSFAAGKTGYEGRKCPRGLTKPLDCMVCVLYFEARPSSYEGMLAVGRVVMERVESRHYPNSICKVAYQPSQFVALPTNRRMSSDPKVMRRVVKAAKDAIAAGGNGWLGFRTCRGGKNHIAGNCFRKTGDLFIDLIPTELVYMGGAPKVASLPYDEPTAEEQSWLSPLEPDDMYDDNGEYRE